MPPKQVKKTTSDKDIKPSPVNIESIQKEWAENVKEIINIREKLTILEKNNEELVKQLWEIMNKTPTKSEVVIDAKPIEKPTAHDESDDEVPEKPADKQADKPVAKKVVKKKEIETDEKPAKSDDKPKTTKKKVVEKPEIEKPAEKPAEKPDDKPAEKPTKGVKKVTPKEEVKTPAKGKIVAPTKGTPKQVVAKEKETENVGIEDTSSDETDIDSLSSVSSESEASGGEDD